MGLDASVGISVEDSNQRTVLRGLREEMCLSSGPTCASPGVCWISRNKSTPLPLPQLEWRRPPTAFYSLYTYH